MDRAEVRAGGELHLEGRATGADLSGGAVAALRMRLHEPLRGMAADLDELVLVACNLLAAASARGRTISPARALRAICEGRHSGCGGAAGARPGRGGGARRAWPEGCAGLAAALAAAHAAVTRAGGAGRPAGRPDRRRRLPGRGGAVAPGGGAGGGPGAGGGACAIATAGPLRLLGAGAVDCDLDVGGDLHAVAPAAASGAARCGRAAGCSGRASWRRGRGRPAADRPGRARHPRRRAAAPTSCRRRRRGHGRRRDAPLRPSPHATCGSGLAGGRPVLAAAA